MLYQRLRTWAPRGLNYCGTCRMWTKRKRGHGGRCEYAFFAASAIPEKLIANGKQGYHGSPKPRNIQRGGNLWTHRSRRGAFGYKLWKKWFNNAAFERMELRLRTDPEDDQIFKKRGNERYDLRRLKSRDVSTSEERNSQARWYT